MFEDQRLLRGLRAGRKDALRRIYQKYIDDLLKVAISLLSDIQSAEDCLHDVFVDFAGAVDGLMIHSNLKSYLISCVANRARDQLRKRTRQSKCQPEQLCSPPMSTSPTKQLIDAEESVRVFEALAELPYQQREVFLLHVQGQMRFREIAGLLGVSINSVQSRYRYAIEKLQAILKEENQNEFKRDKTFNKEITD
ncbi:MAG: RNA polymerase sigma factor [Planctomycetota bacterium]|jgi:RNA polymerase sigma-70 factor (ECF subfamily)